MKRVLIAVSALLLLGACSSAQKKSAAQQSAPKEPEIVDEEFDLLVAPEYDYDSDVPYADQIKNNQPESKIGGKPAKKPVALKQ